MTIYNDDCFNILPALPDKSVQLVLMDLPYNTTPCKFDKEVIPLEKLWEQLDRILKDNGAVVGFAQQPFTSKLVLSNIKEYKYNWIWVKNKCSNFLNQHYQPGKKTEDICVFGKKACSYSPNGNMKYNPQMEKGKPYKTKELGERKASSVVRCNLKQIPIDNKGERLPTNVLNFSLDSDRKFPHPTRKPVELLRYLIRTYTDKGDLILDPTMGVGSCGVASVLENREFIGIEKDENYFNLAKQRIEETEKSLQKTN